MKYFSGLDLKTTMFKRIVNLFKKVGEKMNAKKTELTTKSKEKKSTKGGNSSTLEPQDRQRMIEEAAYYFAEKRNFNGGDPVEDWLAAEADIDAMLK